jgi:hypothetical protein
VGDGWEAKGILAVCDNDVEDQYYDDTDFVLIDCGHCVDGSVCINMGLEGPADACAPYELGVLFAANGGADRMAYAHASLWTGEPLPEPTDCPAIADVPICGGKCGECPAGQLCTGRSPLHPYGLCVPRPPEDASEWKFCGSASDCGAETGCFRWKVQPEAQAVANKRGYCLPLATCQAAAASLPGGGTCVAPP